MHANFRTRQDSQRKMSCCHMPFYTLVKAVEITTQIFRFFK